MKIDPRHLESLSVIVELGTLQLAAQRLATSQPALSRLISNLEARAGVPLFERTKRPLKPTAAGLELAQQGRSIASARIRAEEIIKLGTQGFVGMLKIGAPPFLCKTLVTDAISGFLSERPNVRIDLVSDYHAGLMEKLHLNQIDMIVGPSKFVDHGTTPLIVEPIFNDTNVIVCRTGHPLTKLSKINVSNLRDAVWVGHSSRSLLRLDMETALTEIGIVNPPISLQSESAEAVLEILRGTNFLTFLPVYAIKPDRSDELHVLDVTLPEQQRTVATITLAERMDSKLVEDFKAHLKLHPLAQSNSA